MSCRRECSIDFKGVIVKVVDKDGIRVVEDFWKRGRRNKRYRYKNINCILLTSYHIIQLVI